LKCFAVIPIHGDHGRSAFIHSRRSASVGGTTDRHRHQPGRLTARRLVSSTEDYDAETVDVLIGAKEVAVTIPYEITVTIPYEITIAVPRRRVLAASLGGKQQHRKAQDHARARRCEKCATFWRTRDPAVRRSAENSH
jgi:hypothetical protein